jgi:hypothetical protein
MTRVWWWIEISWEQPNGLSMYLIIVHFVKSLNVDRGLVRKHPWIGNSEGGVVLKIHSFIAMGCWWVAFLFVKLINHILFCMYVCPWEFVGYMSIQVVSLQCWCCAGCWDWVLLWFYVGFGEDSYVERSPLVNHIENNLKWLVVLMKMRLEQSNPERLVVFY